MNRVDFRVQPADYRHWRLSVDGPVATLSMDVDEAGGLVPGYELKLNSYDLGVDIELYDAVQRLRFEHPEVRTVVVTSAKDKIFCAGANIRMLAAADHAWKVNFCKFTNETRNGMEDASANSGQTYVAAVNGTASGGGYELALACEHTMLVDDRSSTVSLPELPLLGVLPGTGGLTRIVDKRHVRRDLADYFATRAEEVPGKKAAQWGLVDEVVPRSKWAETVAARALDKAGAPKTTDAKGVELTPLEKERTAGTIRYTHITTTLGDGKAEEAEERGLVTFAPDDIDWDDEVRIAIEERASFSPDALTGLEANYRFVGPETIETKIFGRLTAWQNWIFYRPNASGPEGALRRFGTGQRAEFDRKRV